jgi:SH3-like domain-containing protein
MANSPFTVFSLTWLSRLSPPHALYRPSFSSTKDCRAVSEKRIRFAAFVLAAQILGAGLLPAAAQQAETSALPAGSFKAYAAEGVEARVSDFSGMPVPRSSSLRYDRVTGRAGPSRDYPVKWTFERQGLPVIIIRETQDWRKVRDPLGDEVWVNKSQLAGARTAITTVEGAIRREASARSAAVAAFQPGAVLQLGDCKGDWCRVEADNRKGWALRSELWGAEALLSAAAAK